MLVASNAFILTLRASAFPLARRCVRIACSTTFEVDGGFRVGVVGLNSTFLQLAGGDYQGKLALDLRQFHAACKSEGGPQDGPAWANRHDVCLLMTHQGLDWLDKSSREDVYPQINRPGRFAMHLFGHMHEEIISSEASRGGSPRRFWQGNSLFSREPIEGRSGMERRHGFAAGSLIFDNDHAMLRHWPRKAVTDPVNSWRFIADSEGCILQDDGGTRAEQIDLGRGKTSSSNNGHRVNRTNNSACAGGLSPRGATSLGRTLVGSY